jgi:hypothetical protein
MSRQEDFIQAGIDYRFENGKPMAIGGGNFAEMAREINRTKPFEAGAEYGYEYAIPEVCHIIRMIYIQNGNKLPSDFEDTVNRRMKML